LPVIDGVGISDQTLPKQAFFENFLIDHVTLIWGKKAWTRRDASQYYYYFDMSPGPGAYKDPSTGRMIPGSPLLFTTYAMHSRLPFRAIFCETDPLNCARLTYNTQIALSTKNQLEMSEKLIVATDVPVQLKNYYTEQTSPGMMIVEESGESQSYVYIRNTSSYTGATSTIRRDRGKWFGLMYIDPNGVDVSFETLARLRKQKKLRGIDFLINLAAGTYKRVRCNPSTHLTMLLGDALRSVPRTVWYVSQPRGEQQWVFLFGIYCVDRPPRFDNWGLFHIDNTVGRQLMYELTYSEKERRAIQPPQGGKRPPPPMRKGEVKGYKVIEHPISRQVFATKGGEIRYCHPWYRPTEIRAEVPSEVQDELGLTYDLAKGWIFSHDLAVLNLDARRLEDRLQSPKMESYYGASRLFELPESNEEVDTK